MPELNCNLYSTGAAVRNAGYVFTSDGTKCIMQKGGITNFHGSMVDNSYQMDFSTLPDPDATAHNDTSSNTALKSCHIKTLQEWHELSTCCRVTMQKRYPLRPFDRHPMPSLPAS